MFAVMVAFTKLYCVRLLDSGQTIDEVNAQLPAFIKDIEAQRQQIIGDVVRWMDEPHAQSHTLQ